MNNKILIAVITMAVLMSSVALAQDYAVTPNKGTTAGGTALTITGSGFTESTRAWMRKGSAYICATPVSQTENELKVKTFFAPAGTYDVIIDAKGDSCRYQYCDNCTVQTDDAVLTNAFTYTDFAYVSNIASDSLSVIDTATGAVHETISGVGVTPLDLAVARNSVQSGRLTYSLVDTTTVPKIKAYETGNFTLAGTFELPTVDGVTLEPLSMQADEISGWLFVASPTKRLPCVPPLGEEYCPPTTGNVMAIDGWAPSAMAVVEGLENIELHNGTDFDGDGFVDGTEVPQRVSYPIDLAVPIVRIELPFRQPTLVASRSTYLDGTYPQRFAYATTAAEVVRRRELRCFSDSINPSDENIGVGDRACEMFVYYTQGPNRISVIDLNPYRITWRWGGQPPPDDEDEEYPDRCVYIGEFEFCFRKDIISPFSTRNIEVEPNPRFGKEIAVLGQIDSFLPPTDIPEELGLTVAKTNGEYVYAISRKYTDKMFKIDTGTLKFVLDENGSPVEIPLGPAPTDVAYGQYQNPDFPYNVNKYLYVAQGGDPAYAETDSSVRVIDTQIPGDGWGFIPDIPLCLNPDDPLLSCGKYPTSIAAMSAPSAWTGAHNVFTTNFETDNVGVIKMSNLLEPPFMIPLSPEQGPKRIDIQPMYTPDGVFLAAWQLIADAPDEFFMASPSKKKELLNQFWSVIVLYANGEANIRALVAQIDNLKAKADRWISNPELKARFIELLNAWKASLMTNR